jgi:hypothetical protein
MPTVSLSQVFHNISDPYMHSIRQIRLDPSRGMLYYNAAMRPPGTDFHGVLYVVNITAPSLPARMILNTTDIWGDFAIDSEGTGFYYFTLSPAPTYYIQLRHYFFADGSDYLLENQLPNSPAGVLLAPRGLVWTSGSGGGNSSYVMQTDVPNGGTALLAKIPCAPGCNCWGGSIAMAATAPSVQCCLYEYTGGSNMVSPFCVPTPICPTISPDWAHVGAFPVANCSLCSLQP